MNISNNECFNWFTQVIRAKPDKIYGIQEEYLLDQRKNKFNLSIGVYRDENGQSFVPSSVRKAEEMVIKDNMHREYAPIEGFEDYRQSVAKFIFGDESEIIEKHRHATVQGLGGTGSLRIGAIFLKQFLTESGTVYLPQQTWSPHKQIFSYSGFEIKYYRYWDSKNMRLGFEALMEDISQMPSFSIIVFHSVAHNPTGADPKLEQWQQIIDLIKRKNIFAVLDCAYQGFASGSVEEDSKSIKLFAQQMKQFIIALTFAKNMGLYGDRIGALIVVCETSDEANNVLSQLKRIIRPIYSHPPNHGPRIVTRVLSDSKLKSEWFSDVHKMQNRISEIRSALKQELNRLGNGDNFWDFIDNQKGMYLYSGLNQKQITLLRHKYSIYTTDEGRINIAAINHYNLKQIAGAIHWVKYNS